MVNPRLIDWADAPAVYVSPSELTAKELAAAISELRVDDSNTCLVGKDIAWVCEAEDFRYFQAVSGQGDLLKHGLACSTEWNIPDQKYYSQSMIVDFNQCVGLYWDEDETTYVIEDPNDW